MLSVPLAHLKREVFRVKHNKAILLISILLLAFIYIGHPILADMQTEDLYMEELIRFHVRANSDTEEDQKLKLKVRDKILEDMKEILEGADSLEKGRYIIMCKLDDIKNVAESVIQENGYDYPVKVTMGIEAFPVRKYGNKVLPQGNYESLIVTIGNGEGQNWWCVMFPPLCFVDVTQSNAVRIDDAEAEEYLLDETQPLKLKSLVADFFK